MSASTRSEERTASQSRFYASLVGPMLGVYYPLPVDMTEAQCRAALNTSKLKNLWCAVYTREEVANQTSRYGGLILDDAFARKLDYDSHVVAEWANVRGRRDV